MSQENVEVVRHMLDAFNHDDVPAVLAAFDESCELTEPSEMLDRPALGFRGHDGIREWMDKLRGLVRARFEPRSFTSSGEVVFSEWASRGVGRASGAPIEWTTFAVVHVRQGKIVRAQGFLSRADALKAAGLSE